MYKLSNFTSKIIKKKLAICTNEPKYSKVKADSET